MHTKFIINGKVCFFSDENRLVPLGDKGAPVALNIPASRCLLLLLQREGEIISQNEFIQTVWESKGQFANANTYFQNIHLLRKALKISGIEDNILKTVPKEGLSFVGTLTYPDEDDGVDVLVPSNDKEDSHSSPLALQQVTNSIAQHPTLFGFRIMTFKILPIGILLILFLILSFQFYNNIANTSSFFSNYQAIGETNQCQVYASAHAILRQHTEYLAFIKDNNIQCRPGQVAYMAMNVAGTRVLVHICDKNINNTNSCLTKLNIVEKNNEQ
jgi:DNA-binding winged helix-turn-helix (wHTH) protein